MFFFLAIAVSKCYCTHGRNSRGKKSRGRKTFIQRFTQIGVTDNRASREELELGTQHHHEELGRLVPAHSTASTRETASEAGPMLLVDDAEERETVLSEPPPAYFSAENGPAPPKYRTLV